MVYLASFQIQLKKSKNWETERQEIKHFSKLGNCLSWLNHKYLEAYENFYNKPQSLFVWFVKNHENCFSGILEVDNQSFLDNILNLNPENLKEFKK